MPDEKLSWEFLEVMKMAAQKVLLFLMQTVTNIEVESEVCHTGIQKETRRKGSAEKAAERLVHGDINGVEVEGEAGEAEVKAAGRC